MNVEREKEVNKQRLVSLLSLKTKDFRSAAILEDYSEPRVQNMIYLATFALLAQTPFFYSTPNCFYSFLTE